MQREWMNEIGGIFKDEGSVTKPAVARTAYE